MLRKTQSTKDVETIRHVEDRRRIIPTAQYESVMNDDDKSPIQVVYARRNRDLDPQLVWRGKDEQDWSDLVVAAPPLCHGSAWSQTPVHRACRRRHVQPRTYPRHGPLCRKQHQQQEHAQSC